MADIINIGTSALLSFQAAINTTSNNISNANTEGYSRQRVLFESLPPTFEGGFYLGSGVGIDSVQRVYDQFLADDVIDRSASSGSAEAYSGFAERVNALFGDSGLSLQSSIDKFYSAMQDVANNPSALPERQALLGQAQQLVDQFDSLNSSLGRLNQEASYQIDNIVADVNSLTSQISSINAQLTDSGTGTSIANNELLDKRNLLVNELGSKVAIQTVLQADGNLNVSLASGVPLITGSFTTELSTFQNQFDASRLEVAYSGRAGDVDISGEITGGALGGILEFRQEMLTPARDQLGLLGASITATVNQQHQLGLDLNGNSGQDFFNDFAITAANARDNVGSAAVAVSYTDISQMTASEYELSFDGTDWTLANLTSGAEQTGSGPFSVDGLSIAISGTPSAGDRFRIQPGRNAAEQFSLGIGDPRAIAAASALRSEQPLSNLGSASLGGITAADASALPLVSGISLTFNPDALGVGIPGFDVTGIAGGPLAYDPSTASGGETLTLGSFEFVVKGVPQAGDTLEILNNTGGTGDNSNALAMAGLQYQKDMLNGTTSQQDLYSGLAADVGIKTSRAQAIQITEATLLDQAEQSVASVSGVNLDEEAADLIRFQQAYQAAAQIISVAETLFDTLLSATRR